MTTSPIKGYRPFSDRAADMVNDNKEAEERILREIDALARSSEIDLRWLSIARSHIEQGFMALNRAIFRPGRVSLPEDEE